MKKLIRKIKKIRAQRRRNKVEKKIRKFFRKTLNKKNLTKIIVIASALALIASYTLPYILR